MKKISYIIFFLGVFGLPHSSWAGDGSKIHWISPAGAAAWADCEKATDQPGGSDQTHYCSVALANANASAGDIVYFKGTNAIGGSGNPYTIVGQYGTMLAPSKSGTDASHMIVFSNAPGEHPVITQQDDSLVGYGYILNGNQYVKLTGFTFVNVQTWVDIYYGASYNEITNCIFTSDTDAGALGGGIVILGTGGPNQDVGSTNNWIHNNYMSKRRDGACNEGVDLIFIGADNTNNSDNNTFENNYLEYGAHSIFNVNTHKNVIRNNIMHNEPWITGCTSYETNNHATSTTSNTIPSNPYATPMTFYVAPNLGLGYGLYSPIAIYETSNLNNVMNGYVTSYTSSTGQINANIYYSSGSGTYSDWTLSEGQIPYYGYGTIPVLTQPSSNYNGLYGHRDIALGENDQTNPNYSLVEGNRIGYPSLNPNNAGSSGIDAQSPTNIIRYNYLYGGMDSGIYFKYTNQYGNHSGGVYNHVFNNTIYGFGLGWKRWRI